MITNSTFAHWLLVMDTPDGLEEAKETRNAWHVISKDSLTGTAILIPVMREGKLELDLAHHICRCEFFAIVGVDATPLQPALHIIQVPANWFNQGKDVIVT